MTIIGGIEVPKEGVKILHDPEKIINLLHDLPNSSTIFHMLEIYKADGRPGKMLYRNNDAKMYMLLLYRYPKWMEPEGITNPSETMLFIASNLAAFIKYFYIWFNHEEEGDRKNIIFEIQDLLYEHQKLEQEAKKQPQH